MRPLAERTGRLGTETAFEMLARARALEAKGRSVVHLEIGEPDFASPAAVVAAGTAALARGETHYTPAAGLPALRQAIAESASRARGITVRPEQVVVTAGAKAVMFYVMMALLEEGDEAIYPDPGFPIYSSMVAFAGARGIPLPLRESNDFSLDLDELRALVTPRTKLLILNSPHNPTGGVLGAEAVREIARLAVERDLWVLTDEVYSEILYDGRHHSIASEPGMAERTIILDGFSKTFAMTGWRIGYGVFPMPLVETMTRLVVNSISCVPGFTQLAGLAALASRPPEVDVMVAAFRERRDAIVRGLNAIEGWSCRMPHGAFYVFPNVSRLERAGVGVVSDRLLEEAGVAALSGSSFGAAGAGHLRLSYANSMENLALAVDRIAAWTKGVLPKG